MSSLRGAGSGLLLAAMTAFAAICGARCERAGLDDAVALLSVSGWEVNKKDEDKVSRWEVNKKDEDEDEASPERGMVNSTVSAGYACEWPLNMKKWALITLKDAKIHAHDTYSNIAIGGDLYDGTPQESGNIWGRAFVEGKMKGDTAFNICTEGQIFGCSTTNTPVKKPLSEIVDYGHFEWLARNLQTSTNGKYKVVVKTQGGTYNTEHFNAQQDGHGVEEDNGLTLAVFNTKQPVKIVKKQNGRKFGPSILAPFSKVTLTGDAGFIDGSIVAKSLDGSGPGYLGQLQLHSDAYEGPFTCKETPPPTRAPTDSPTNKPTPPPTRAPTDSPTGKPTPPPTRAPTDSPTDKPTPPPTRSPTDSPTNKPTPPPTRAPTDPEKPDQTDPTPNPTSEPTMDPTKDPTPMPTPPPTAPTPGPTPEATVTDDPHLRNLAGERFDVNRPGEHLLLRVPLEPLEPSLLQVHGAMGPMGTACGLFTTMVTLTGEWLGEAVVRVRPLRRSEAGGNGAGNLTEWPFSVQVSTPDVRGEWVPFERLELGRSFFDSKSLLVRGSAARREQFGSRLESEAFRFDVGEDTDGEQDRASITIAQASHQALNVAMANLGRLGHPRLGGLLGTEHHDKALERLTQECLEAKARSKQSSLIMENRTEAEPRLVATWS